MCPQTGKVPSNWDNILDILANKSGAHHQPSLSLGQENARFGEVSRQRELIWMGISDSSAFHGRLFAGPANALLSLGLMCLLTGVASSPALLLICDLLYLSLLCLVFVFVSVFVIASLMCLTGAPSSLPFSSPLPICALLASASVGGSSSSGEGSSGSSCQQQSAQCPPEKNPPAGRKTKMGEMSEWKWELPPWTCESVKSAKMRGERPLRADCKIETARNKVRQILRRHTWPLAARGLNFCLVLVTRWCH